MSFVEPARDRLEGLLPRRDGVLFTTRCNSRLFGAWGASDSSLELDEDVAGLYVSVGREKTVTWRSSEIDTVASAAISRARAVDRGFVVKTTKNGMDEERVKVAGSGKVIYVSIQRNSMARAKVTYGACEWNRAVRMKGDLEP